MLKYRVILIHGWVDSPKTFKMWEITKGKLQEQGIKVFVCDLPALSSIKERSDVLVTQIEEATAPGEKVHLIGHSMVRPCILDLTATGGLISCAGRSERS